MKYLSLLAVMLMLSACEKKVDLTPLTIMTENGEVNYQVETAMTREEMSRGLMKREFLKADSGMIFNVGGQSQIAMWMQDTYIPLDMLFVCQDGVICSIHENAEPMSTALIRPQVDDPIFAVIELNGGDVKKQGIKVGDTVRHQLLK